MLAHPMVKSFKKSVQFVVAQTVAAEYICNIALSITAQSVPLRRVGFFSVDLEERNMKSWRLMKVMFPCCVLMCFGRWRGSPLSEGTWNQRKF